MGLGRREFKDGYASGNLKKKVDKGSSFAPPQRGDEGQVQGVHSRAAEVRRCPLLDHPPTPALSENYSEALENIDEKQREGVKSVARRWSVSRWHRPQAMGSHADELGEYAYVVLLIRLVVFIFDGISNSVRV